MVQVYQSPLCRRHYTSWFSLAVLVRLTLLLGSIALAITVAYATGGFWVKIKPTLDQPTVKYTSEALLLFEGDTPGEEMIWSTSLTLNTEFADRFIPANIQAGEDDVNFDGKPDIITFVASVQSARPVYGVKALVQLTYDFDSSVRLQMYTFAYLSATSPTPGGALFTDGELVLNQRSPITDRKYNGLYNQPMLAYTTPSILEAAQPSTMLQFETILRNYLGRNYTTTYANNYPVWKAASGNTFTLNMVIRIPPQQVIWYRPQVIEMLKFAWIQFLATWIVLWWFYSYLEALIFGARLVDTRIVSDVQGPRAKQQH